jgi:hypothetical protein
LCRGLVPQQIVAARFDVMTSLPAEIAADPTVVARLRDIETAESANEKSGHPRTLVVLSYLANRSSASALAAGTNARTGHCSRARLNKDSVPENLQLSAWVVPESLHRGGTVATGPWLGPIALPVVTSPDEFCGRPHG